MAGTSTDRSTREKSIALSESTGEARPSAVRDDATHFGIFDRGDDRRLVTWRLARHIKYRGDDSLPPAPCHQSSALTTASIAGIARIAASLEGVNVNGENRPLIGRLAARR